MTNGAMVVDAYNYEVVSWTLSVQKTSLISIKTDEVLWCYTAFHQRFCRFKNPQTGLFTLFKDAEINGPEGIGLSEEA